MNLLRTVFFYIVLLLIPSYGMAADFDYMRISFIDGDVQMRTLESADWGYAALNDPIREGDEFWVPQNGRLEIQLKSGTYIRLDQESAIQMLSKEKDSLQFYLSQGHAYVVNDAPEGSVTQIDTGDASTRVRVNSIFRVDMMDKYTDVGVYKDYVEVENKEGSYRVNAGEVVSLGLDTNGEVAPMGGQDEWEKWNIARNHDGGSNPPVVATTKPETPDNTPVVAITNPETPDNLPVELKTYSDELDSSGKWVDVSEYGKVWIPAVKADWAPYKDGRWVWRDDDYVWVASESWGWAPYHYGRWAFVEGTGWFWVPPIAGEVYWSPGYVGWVTTGDYVAWVPLAPGETYYGRGYYGRDSVDLTTVDPNQINVAATYINIGVNNGATVVERNTFATAAPRIVSVDRQILSKKVFVRTNMSVGAPPIKPTHASYFASPRIIPASQLPPRAVRNMQVRELKQTRPFMREQSKSVMNPGMKAARLPVHQVASPVMRGKSRHPVFARTTSAGGVGQRGIPKVAQKQSFGRDRHEVSRQPQVMSNGGRGNNELNRGHNPEVRTGQQGMPKVAQKQSFGRDTQPQVMTNGGRGNNELNRGRNPEVRGGQQGMSTVDRKQGFGRDRREVSTQPQVRSNHAAIPGGHQQTNVRNRTRAQDTVTPNRNNLGRSENQTLNKNTRVPDRNAVRQEQSQVRNQPSQNTRQQKPVVNRKADDRQKKQRQKDGKKDDDRKDR